MNVSSTRANAKFQCEMKPFEAPFLSTNDPQFSWLKYQFLKYFEDWLTTTEVRPDQEYMKSLRNKKCFYHQKYINGIKITVHTVIELTNSPCDYA